MKEIRWNQALLKEFLRSHAHQQICIMDQRSRAFLVGIIPAVYEMDLCSGTLSEAALNVENMGCDVSLTMHEQFLGIHLFFFRQNTEEQILSFPWEIPYSSLQLELVPERMDA
tara:strand:+ start:3101 stop:3439 length:339 start_codon:yes stop_codon:yes gene_type:complete